MSHNLHVPRTYRWTEYLAGRLSVEAGRIAAIAVGCLACLAVPAPARAESTAADEGWSQDLLSRLLSSPEAEVAGSGARGMVLRSYQLRVLHLGDPGRATNLVSILRRMLPPESRVSEDRAANTLHILSTTDSHEAALEFISAMDADAAAAPGEMQTARVPEEVRKALEALAAARPDSERLLQVLAETARQSEDHMADALRRSHDQTQHAFTRAFQVGGLALVVILAGGGVGLALLMRRVHRRDIEEVTRRETTALSLLPNQGMDAVMAVSREQQERTKELQKLMESFSIAYQADRQRSAVMLETVTKKHGDTLEQMVRLRQEMGENAGRAFLEINRAAIDEIISEASEALTSRANEVGLIAESASRKMEETASRLEVQNARAEALANELERTQREVDSLFEKLRTAQELAQQAQSDADAQRRIAYEKAAELAKREAALAGLSLLMQEPVSSILDTMTDVEPPPAQVSADCTRAAQAVEQPEGAEAGATSPGPMSAPSSPDPDPSCPTKKYTFRISPAA